MGGGTDGFAGVLLRKVVPVDGFLPLGDVLHNQVPGFALSSLGVRSRLLLGRSTSFGNSFGRVSIRRSTLLERYLLVRLVRFVVNCL